MRHKKGASYGVLSRQQAARRDPQMRWGYKTGRTTGLKELQASSWLLSFRSVLSVQLLSVQLRCRQSTISTPRPLGESAHGRRGRRAPSYNCAWPVRDLHDRYGRGRPDTANFASCDAVHDPKVRAAASRAPPQPCARAAAAHTHCHARLPPQKQRAPCRPSWRR